MGNPKLYTDYIQHILECEYCSNFQWLNRGRLFCAVGQQMYDLVITMVVLAGLGDKR